MELLQTVVNAAVVGAVGVILGAMVHGLRGEISDLRAEVKSDISELRTEFRAEIQEVRRDITGLRSDLTQIALAVGARPSANRNP